MQTFHEFYTEKANLCRINAMRCETEWSKNYWLGCALALEEKAANLPLVATI